VVQSQIPTGYKYSVIEYTSLGEKTFIAKIFIHEFGVDDVVPYIMAMRDQNKIIIILFGINIIITWNLN